MDTGVGLVPLVAGVVGQRHAGRRPGVQRQAGAVEGVGPGGVEHVGLADLLAGGPDRGALGRRLRRDLRAAGHVDPRRRQRVLELLDVGGDLLLRAPSSVSVFLLSATRASSLTFSALNLSRAATTSAICACSCRASMSIIASWSVRVAGVATAEQHRQLAGAGRFCSAAPR